VTMRSNDTRKSFQIGLSCREIEDIENVQNHSRQIGVEFIKKMNSLKKTNNAVEMIIRESKAILVAFTESVQITMKLISKKCEKRVG